MSGGRLRGAENFRFFADRAPGARDGLVAARARASELHAAPADRAGRGDHAVEHAVHAVDLEDRAGARGRLHGRAQAGRVEPAHRDAARRDLTEAGVPAGVLNLVHGYRRDGRQGADRASGDSSRSRFVGESATGSCIMAQGAPTLKRVHFELGGKNPVIVFEDADLDRALDAVVFMIYSLNGERCTSSSRLLVQRSIDERFHRAARRHASQAQGRPSARSRDRDRSADSSDVTSTRCSSYFEVAREEGVDDSRPAARAAGDPSRRQLRAADAVRGRAQRHARRAGRDLRPGADGRSRSPTRPRRSRSPTTRRYGLAGYLWTSDVGRAHRMARKRSRPAWSGSIRRTIATCRRRSAA